MQPTGSITSGQRVSSHTRGHVDQTQFFLYKNAGLCKGLLCRVSHIVEDSPLLPLEKGDISYFVRWQLTKSTISGLARICILWMHLHWLVRRAPYHLFLGKW